MFPRKADSFTILSLKIVVGFLKNSSQFSSILIKNRPFYRVSYRVPVHTLNFTMAYIPFSPSLFKLLTMTSLLLCGCSIHYLQNGMTSPSILLYFLFAHEPHQIALSTRVVYKSTHIASPVTC